MTEMQMAMQALYRACRNQYNSKDSCRGCLLCDVETAEQISKGEYDGSFCEANHPMVWDALHTWLKEGEDDDTCNG